MLRVRTSSKRELRTRFQETCQMRVIEGKFIPDELLGRLQALTKLGRAVALLRSSGRPRNGPTRAWRMLLAARETDTPGLGPGHWGMNGILFLTAPILPTFVASFGRCIKMLMVPFSVLCGTRTRKLFAIA